MHVMMALGKHYVLEQPRLLGNIVESLICGSWQSSLCFVCT